MRTITLAAVLAAAGLPSAATAQFFDPLACFSFGFSCGGDFMPDGFKFSFGMGDMNFDDSSNNYSIYAPDGGSQRFSIYWENGANQTFSSNFQATIFSQTADVESVMGASTFPSYGAADLTAVMLGFGLDVPLFNATSNAPVSPAAPGDKVGTVSAYGSLQAGKAWVDYNTTTPWLENSDSGAIIYGEVGAAVQVTENVSLGVGVFGTRFEGKEIKSSDRGAQLSVRVGF